MDHRILSPFKLTLSGIKWSPFWRSYPPGLMGDLKERLNRQKCLILPDIIDEELLCLLEQENEQAEFQDISNEEIGRELGTLNQETIRRMNALVNDDSLFGLVQELCDLPRIGCFTGRIVKMLPSFSLGWHSDYYTYSVVGFSINIGSKVFEGGEFQIRNCRSQEIYGRVRNINRGDGLLFLLGDELEHQLTEIQGNHPRFTFVGWFRSDPHFTQEEYRPLLQECLED